MSASVKLSPAKCGRWWRFQAQIRIRPASTAAFNAARLPAGAISSMVAFLVVKQAGTVRRGDAVAYPIKAGRLAEGGVLWE